MIPRPMRWAAFCAGLLCIVVFATTTALIKDINGATQLLLLPTARVSGIESPALLERGALNYFAAAWQARSYLDKLAGRTPARDAVALAINSASGRT
jgi:CDP-diacylglycerol pyrophosphatase